MTRQHRVIAAVLSLVLVLALIGGAAGCGKKTAKEIVIGVVGPLTGGSAQLGLAQKNGVELAVAEINAAGGVNGQQIKAIYEDDEASPTKGTNATNKLIASDKAVAVIGAVNSSVSLALRSVTDKAKIPQLTISTGSAVNAAEYKYIFMTALSDRDQAKSLVNYAVDQLGYTKLGFMTAADDYGESGRKLLEAAAQAKGAQIVAQEKFNGNDKDFKTQLLKLNSAGAEGIFMWGVYTDGALILKQAREMGVKAQFFAGSGMTSTKLIELAGSASEGFLMTQAYVATADDARVQKFVTDYKARYSTDPIAHAVQAYDTVYILADAIKRAGAAEPEKIREALAATKDLQTLTGVLHFDDINVVQGKDVYLIEVKNGTFALVKKGV